MDKQLFYSTAPLDRAPDPAEGEHQPAAAGENSCGRQ
jgi:hypothetical protein